MKKGFLFLVLVATFFVGCSSDSEGGLQVNEENLLGKWYLKGGKLNNEPFEDHEHDCPSLKDSQEFFNNHTVTFLGYDINCEVNDTQTTNWTLSGNTLTLTYDNPAINSEVYKVESITDEELRLKQTFTSSDGTQSYVYYLTKN